MVGKGNFAKEHSEIELRYAYKSMSKDISRADMPNAVNTLFELAWDDYCANKFRFDGAVFFPERASSKWEWTSFIRIWLNSCGFVGYRIDYIFMLMMLATGFHNIDLILRGTAMLLCTWFDIVKHRVIKTDFRKLSSDESLFGLYENICEALVLKIKSNI